MVLSVNGQGHVNPATGRIAGAHASIRHGHFQDNLSARDRTILKKDMRRVMDSRMLSSCDKRLNLRAELSVRHLQDRQKRQIGREIRIAKHG